MYKILLYYGRSIKFANDDYDKSPFFNKKSLKSVIFGSSGTSIYSGCFAGCSSLTTIDIPNSITSIGKEAFSGCSGLTEVILKDGDQILEFGEDVFYDTNLQTLYCGRTFNYPVTFNNSRLSPFSNLESLKSVTFGHSVTSIGKYAFSGCSGLTSLDIPDSVTAIDYSAFSGCSGLTSLQIPNSVSSIDSYAFSGCSGLTSFQIPNSVS